MSSKKSKILYILKILKENSDEKHPMTMTDIINYLTNYGIEACSKTVSSDIKLLQEFGTDIVCDKSRQNQYFIGERDFEIPEIKLLIDAVSSSRFIPKNKSKSLVSKLTSFVSKHQEQLLTKHLYLDTQIKQLDTKVFYTVDLINAAIDLNTKISFQYFEYDCNKKKVFKHNGYKYIFSPYALIWNGDYYYALGYSEKHMDLTTFRVDRITKIKLLKDMAVSQPKNWNVTNYINKVFSMYDGKPIDVKLKCKNKLMNSIIDRFGEDVTVENIDENLFIATVEVAISPTFFSWVFQFAPDMSIVAPQSVVLEYYEKAQSIKLD